MSDQYFHQKVRDVLVTGLFTAEDIVHVKNIIAILVIVAIVLNPLTRLRQYTPRIPRGFIVEAWIAYAVSRRKVGR